MNIYKKFPKPWLNFYGNVPESINYPHKTMYELVRDAAKKHSNLTAWHFLGRSASYNEFLNEIDLCADALKELGICAGDAVTICLPNVPQAVIAFYALNKLGAVASMIHPLSAPKEIEFYLNESSSVFAITLDAFYKNFKDIIKNTKCRKVIIAKISDYLGPLKTVGFYLTKGRKIEKIEKDQYIVFWEKLIESTKIDTSRSNKSTALPEDVAVILYSGGTSGKPKGIMLTNNNFNALAMQTAVQGPVIPGETMMAILPLFHGFGLGVCVHTAFISALRCVLIPQFSTEIFADSLRYKPNYIAGVPTLYEALLKSKKLTSIDLSSLKGVFSGGDKLPYSTKLRFDKFLKEHGAKVTLREGYGLTESVTACSLNPDESYREGSVGIPFSDMLIKIVEPDTSKEVKVGNDGEICVFGPTVMKGYLNNESENDKVLRVHEDGRKWLHTGDCGYMDEDGFLYFRQRLKRIIKSSGIAVYPSQVEDALDKHPKISYSCVIGVPDEYQIEIVKAFIVLKDNIEASEQLIEDIKEYCKEYMIKWAIPQVIEFRDTLPKTRVGKIAFSVLEEEEKIKRG